MGTIWEASGSAPAAVDDRPDATAAPPPSTGRRRPPGSPSLVAILLAVAVAAAAAVAGGVAPRAAPPAADGLLVPEDEHPAEIVTPAPTPPVSRVIVIKVPAEKQAPPVETDETSPVEKPAPTALPAPKPGIGFTANQRFGSSDASPPFDVFWGTANPGTTVGVWSAYGQARTSANGDGAWEVRIAFPEAPVGKTFPVKVKTPAGDLVAFEFTRLGPSPTPHPRTAV